MKNDNLVEIALVVIVFIIFLFGAIVVYSNSKCDSAISEVIEIETCLDVPSLENQ